MKKNHVLPIVFLGLGGCGEANFSGRLVFESQAIMPPTEPVAVAPSPIPQPVGEQEIVKPLEESVSLEVETDTYCLENPLDPFCSPTPQPQPPTGTGGTSGSGGGSGGGSGSGSGTGTTTTPPPSTNPCSVIPRPASCTTTPPPPPDPCSVIPRPASCTTTTPTQPVKILVQEDFYRPGPVLPGQLDMIWVIDDSLSMGDKRTIVKNNLKAFSEKIQAFSNLKLGLVSYYDLLPSIPGVTLSHNRVLVGSNNPMALATANACTASQSSPAGTSSGVRICGQLISDGTGQWRGDIRPDFYNTLADSAGCLFEGGNSRTLNRSVMGMPSCAIPSGRRFFTPDNRVAVAFVTDDDEMNVSPAHFIETMKKAMNRDIAACTAQKNCNFPIVFAFGANNNSRRDFSSGGCNASRVSRKYVDLVSWTGGKYEQASEPEFPYYDVCRSDWSPYFNHMLGKLKTSTTVVFSTSRTPVPFSVSIKVLKTEYYINSSGQVVEDTTKRQSPSDPTARTLREGVEYTINSTQVTLQKGAITLPTRTGAVGQRIAGEVVRVFYRY